MIAMTTTEASKSTKFAQTRVEPLDRLDTKAEALATRPTRLFPLTPSQVKELIS